MAHYRFNNLLGAPYRGGNLCMSGNHLLTSVGNRVMEVDLQMSSSQTLPCENLTEIRCIAVSPSGSHMISFDTDGRALLVNLRKRVVLHHMNFKGKVSHCEFSPCGRSFAVCVGKLVQIWATPTMLKEFAPFRLLRTYGGMYDEATCLAWSPDSRWIIVGSKDLTARIYSANHMEGYVPPTLAGHREQLCHVTFAGGGGDAAYTVSKDGALFEWRLVDEDVDGTDDTARRGDKGARGGRDSLRGGDGVAVRRWRMEGKHFFHMPAKLTCAAYHPGTGMLCAGFGHGVFTLHRLSPGGFEMVHTLSISQQKVTACQWNETGDWIGLGCARLGQVVVWEWQSEAYVYKQQGHYFDVNQCAYAPDGSMLATASDDNKVKVWSTATGSCFVTFTEHKAPVSAVTFAPSGHAVVSASLDGTVRAFDLMRYRNFRTLTSPEPAQFISLAVDPSGEVVCAGSQDTFQIHIWSMKTGRMLDILSGHQGPVTSLSFSPESALLASGSWDKSVRLWDVYEGRGQTDVLPHAHDVLAVAFRPDGKQVAVSTLDGQVFLWNPNDAQMQGTIEGRRDMAGGKVIGDLRSATAKASKSFKTLAYSADGAVLLAGGNGKYVCMYDVDGRALLKKFPLSKSKALDGTIERLDSNRVTDAGPMDLLPASDSEEDDEGFRRGDRGRGGAGSGGPGGSLPGAGAWNGAGSSRSSGLDVKKRPVIRCKHVTFAPTGQGWAASTTEGVMVFTRDTGAAFDPTDLGEDVTPSAARRALRHGDARLALLMSLRLKGADDDESLVAETLERVAPDAVASALRDFPTSLLAPLLESLAERVTKGPHAHLMLRWTRELCVAHGRAIHSAAHGGGGGAGALVGAAAGCDQRLLPALRRLSKAFANLHNDLEQTAEASVFLLDYVCAAPAASAKA